MPLAPRLLPTVVTTSLLAALAIAPVAGASQRASVVAPDGLKAQPDAARVVSPSAKRGVKARAAQAAATDPRAAEQWPLNGDAPMGLASAWRQTTGNDLTVAIIDSGIDLGHPDLAPNLWTNPGEVPGNGVDDDGNGYVDDVNGYDFVERDGTPQDGNGHGTHVAGIVGARGGNGIGVAGVSWRVKLMAVRVLDGAARGTTTDVALGIRYAVDNGARIVNLSLAGPASTPDLEDAVRYAQAHGVLIVVAAGNEGADLAAAPTYPAAYGESNVIGVAATRRDGGLSSVSDYGPGADLAAPGEEILSTALGGGYEWRTGTSMAAPEVTGALALIAAARPDLDANGLSNALLGGTRKGGLPVATGALDVGASLKSVIPSGSWIDGDASAPLSSYTTTTTKKASKKKSTSTTAKKKATKKLTAAQKKARAKKAAAKKRAAAKKSAAKKRAARKAAAHKAAAKSQR